MRLHVLERHCASENTVLPFALTTIPDLMVVFVLCCLVWARWLRERPYVRQSTASLPLLGAKNWCGRQQYRGIRSGLGIGEE